MKKINLKTKTLIDPEVEKRGEQRGGKRGEQKKAIEVAKNMKAEGMNVQIICQVTGLSEQEVIEA